MSDPYYLPYSMAVSQKHLMGNLTTYSDQPASILLSWLLYFICFFQGQNILRIMLIHLIIFAITGIDRPFGGRVESRLIRSVLVNPWLGWFFYLILKDLFLKISKYHETLLLLRSLLLVKVTLFWILHSVKSLKGAQVRDFRSLRFSTVKPFCVGDFGVKIQNKLV